MAGSVTGVGLKAGGPLIVEDGPGAFLCARGSTLLACISKNDRAEPLFEAMATLVPGTLRLGHVTPGRGVKLVGALASLSADLAQTRSDMEFSPVVARAAQRLTAARIAEHRGVTHVLQWGAMYAPVGAASGLTYSLVTDGPFDPDDPAYPVEWKPKRWAAEYFARQSKIYREAAFVFTLSEWAREKLLGLHSLDSGRVVRIGWGPMFEAAPNPPSTARSQLFVSIGNEWQRKGMDLVASAGERLHAACPDADTILAGAPEGMSLTPAPGVTLMPRRLSQQEVQGLLRRARALVVASRFDASPHIVVEALQLGVPVIGSDVCGIPEAVQAPLGGRVVPAGDVEALLSAMRIMLQEDAAFQRADALRAYEAMGGWAAAAQRVEQALRASGLL